MMKIRIGYSNSSNEEDFFGFPNCRKLDRKLNLSYIKLERLKLDVLPNHSQKVQNGKDSIILIALANKTDLQNRPFCIYCKEYQSQFARHIRVHNEEKHVQSYINADTKEEKTRILAFIRNQGYGLLEKLTGKIKPVKRLRKGVSTNKVPCLDAKLAKYELSRKKENYQNLGGSQHFVICLIENKYR
ncbi:hypothetical protein TSAR_016250 [Trichomalopsis sarcophagae]|uniref:Uncharacterized protein n=1 Tax=Trichomalopsis sarcophagae TaxID=543379 RepID=A0A232ET84_9HYME|nr:hypothetical protein TSAR_016250 [Trichomalopsis sarcophagae]